MLSNLVIAIYIESQVLVFNIDRFGCKSCVDWAGVVYSHGVAIPSSTNARTDAPDTVFEGFVVDDSSPSHFFGVLYVASKLCGMPATTARSASWSHCDEWVFDL